MTAPSQPQDVGFTYRMGEDHLADRGGSRETEARPAASTALGQALEELLPEGGSTAVLTLERHSGGEKTVKTVTVDPDYLGISLDWMDWSYRHKPATFSEANEMIDRYIYFYNHERIQIKTGEAPLTRRLSS